MEQKQRVVLVIEDEQPLVDAIKIKLGKEGFDSITARTVNQALQYLEEKVKIDVVWLDHYLLGKEDGLDFVVAIKKNDSPWKNVPIFVVSNTATPEKIQSYLALGIKRYYAKSDHRLEDIIKEIKEFKE